MTTILLFNVVMSAFIYQGQGVVNFAFHKSANQSSTLTYGGFEWTADKAVDGNIDGSDPENIRTSTCSATIATTSFANPTWEVDIGFQIIVTTITVYGRTDTAENQLDGVRLYLGNNPGPWNYSQAFSKDPSSVTQLSRYVFKLDNIIARFISLERVGKILIICEVNVEGTVNFALHKSAVESTTLNYNNFNWTADKAVDGNSSGSDPDHSMTCSSTTHTGVFVNHTWEVDIGFQIIVKTITVYGRSDGNNDNLSGVKLFIGNVSMPWRYNQDIPSTSSSRTKYVFKPNNAIASVISLMRYAVILVICEVTVEGECLDGNFSEFCNLTCGKCYAGQPCNKENGTCPLGCDQGWKGTLCKEGCKKGNYGYNCNETCGNCLYGNDSCSTSDGNCTKGCIAGWQGYRCHKGCERGNYGYNCNETCGHCLYGNDNCSTSDGNCTKGCIAGWQGYRCQKGCVTGTYGYNCNDSCGNCLNGNNNCSTINGSCRMGCNAGWQGDDCKKECDAGTYGLICNETCGYCLNGNNSCSNMNGQCSGGCQAGWTGETCKSECELGTYGFNCTGTCGYCLKGNNICSKINGHCSGDCQSGWKGETCKSECEVGTYGFNCNETCGSCLNGNNSCLKISGQCTGGCLSGWRGETCTSECEAGTYGFNCNETCGYCLNGNNSCSRVIGHCSDGCQTGWRGETCKSGTLESVTTVDAAPNTGAIVGSVLAAVAVSILAMVIIILIVKKRRKNHNNEASTDNVTTAAHYANMVAGNPVCKIASCTITEMDTTFSAIEEARLRRGMPIGATNNHSAVMEPDVPVHNVYEKLQDVIGSIESAYYTIDHNCIGYADDQQMESMEPSSTYVETLQSLECALKSVEEGISVLFDKKEQLLSKELETARANKFGDKWKKKDSDKDKDSTIVHFVQALQSMEGELRVLEEKRKCLLGRKEILLRQELAKTTANEK